ncbi:MAG: hypothetical protein MZV49_16410 [Rhodopseudomonas palustris]|nr:hypothetical protein [Rhodopseudomonas palustris]
MLGLRAFRMSAARCRCPQPARGADPDRGPVPARKGRLRAAQRPAEPQGAGPETARSGR